MNVSQHALPVEAGNRSASARHACFTLLAAFSLCLGLPAVAFANGERILVDNAEALQAAMVPENAGRRIVLRAGSYGVTNPLVVPDGATLQGRGAMLGDEYPVGLDAASSATIFAAPGFVGDLVTLGNGSRLSRLNIRQVEGSEGNAVVVGSRAPGDSVAATIAECEIVNPNVPGVGPQGPIGRGVVVIARNPNIAAEPPPHDGAAIRLSMSRSVVRSPGGASAIFAINFASNALVKMVLQGNALGGGLDFATGVSRGDYVRGSKTEIRSSGNLYFSEPGLHTRYGVRILGGSDAPIPMGWPGSDENVASFRSKNDTIDGFSVGLMAAAGNRFTEENGTSSGNTVELRLHGLVLDSFEADLEFVASYVEANNLEPGAENVLSVFGRGIAGSGAGPNLYIDAGPGYQDYGWWSEWWYGQGNRLFFLGRGYDFRVSNSNLNPFPHSSYFRSW